MNGKKIILVAMLVALIAISSVSFAAVRFDFVGAGPGNNQWKLSALVGATPPKWQVYIESIDNPAVGRVWYPNGTWASALYTYAADIDETWRPAQRYRTVVSYGDGVKWGMRLNNDYTGVVNVSGWFYP